MTRTRKSVSLQFEAPPEADIAAPTTTEIAEALAAHTGEWAVVYRADRLARAERHAESIRSGLLFGPGHEAAVRKVGAECRVYARSVDR